jgi:hypothetical protein
MQRSHGRPPDCGPAGSSTLLVLADKHCGVGLSNSLIYYADRLKFSTRPLVSVYVQLNEHTLQWMLQNKLQD